VRGKNRQRRRKAKKGSDKVTAKAGDYEDERSEWADRREEDKRSGGGVWVTVWQKSIRAEGHV
jgi:hypothetical protein